MRVLPLFVVPATVVLQRQDPLGRVQVRRESLHEYACYSGRHLDESRCEPW